MTGFNPNFVTNLLSKHLDIKSIIKLIQTNKEIATAIPSSKKFWSRLFKNNNVPIRDCIIPKTVDG